MAGKPASECNASVLIRHLEQQHPGTVGHGTLNDGSLTDRGKDRARILLQIANHPEGIGLNSVVHRVIKGVNPETWTGHVSLSGADYTGLDRLDRDGNCIALDGSDADYQFALRFVKQLESAGLVSLRRDTTEIRADPKLALLDLISEGITETDHSNNDVVHDREFAGNILKGTNDLSDGQKEFFADSLNSYIRRVDDYRLCFDAQMFDHRGRGGQKRRFTKDYKTRFNDYGRVAKQFSKFHGALEQSGRDAENAVICTLTSDPGTLDDPDRPDPRSLHELIDSINENFHRLTQWMKTDPKTKPNERDEWTGSYTPENDVTSRPRQKLDYLKVLEFTERGLPHLHVLFFDVPEKQVLDGRTDGMPYLVNKQELSDKWSDYGQGEIVDLHPLTWCDDLDSLDADFTKEAGFVDWYRYGSHGLDDDTIDSLGRGTGVDMAGDDDDPQEKTAGSYLGKYLSMTFGALLEASESNDIDDLDGYGDKVAMWKLGVYWATGRKFWSLSRSLEKKVERDSPHSDDVERGIRWAIKSDVLSACRTLGHDLDDLDGDTINRADPANAHSAVSQIVATPRARIDYLGTYHIDDLPTDTLAGSTLDTSDVSVVDDDPPDLLSIGDRPPPTAEVW